MLQQNARETTDLFLPETGQQPSGQFMNTKYLLDNAGQKLPSILKQ